VLCHNDIHQNNILMRLRDNRDLLIIDNEYAGWNPMAMDLAVYINETMIHNTHPADNGVKEYADNLMSEYEQEMMIKSYMREYFNKYMHSNQKAEYEDDDEQYIEANYATLKR
jgi:thiamine kinase-like enzyme